MQITDEVRKRFPGEWSEEDEDVYDVWAAFLLVPNLMHRFPPLVTEEELRAPREPND